MDDRVHSTPPIQNPARVSQSFGFGSLEAKGRRSLGCKDDELEEGRHTLAGMAGYRTLEDWLEDEDAGSVGQGTRKGSLHGTGAQELNDDEVHNHLDISDPESDG